MSKQELMNPAPPRLLLQLSAKNNQRKTYMDTVINVVHNADIYGFFHSKLYSVNIIGCNSIKHSWEKN